MSFFKDILPIDLEADDAIAGASTDAKTAPEALRIAAGYMRRRELLPPALADYLASAFEVAALKPEGHQANALALELGLMAQNRRPSAVRPWDVAEFVDDLENGNTERQRMLAAMNRFKVSEGTIRRLLPSGRAACEEYMRLQEEEARDHAEHNIRMQAEILTEVAALNRLEHHDTE